MTIQNNPNLYTNDFLKEDNLSQKGTDGSILYRSLCVLFSEVSMYFDDDDIISLTSIQCRACLFGLIEKNVLIAAIMAKKM